MAFKSLIFTCQRSTFCALLSSFSQTTSTVCKQLKKNYFSYRLTHSTNEENKENFYNIPEVKKYLDFISETDISSVATATGMRRDRTQRLYALLENKKNIELELENLNNMTKEDAKELKDLIFEEKCSLREKLLVALNQIFENVLFHEEEDDDRNVEIQILPGIGGAEAKLFAEELFNMYVKYAEYKNWECPLAEVKGQSDFTSAYIMMNGSFVYNYMKHEGGVHRVQRVPETEKSGRTHTSTCSVVVLPQPKPHEIVIKPKDLIIEKTTSCGAGGQNVNKRETAVRIKHIPSGVVVESQESRYQYQNKSIAIERLRGILFNMELEKINLERNKSRKEQAGTNAYSDKIRTYNFNQNRITDHRINFSLFNMKTFFLGEKCLDEMISKLRETSKKETLLNHVRKILESVEYKSFEKKKISNKSYGV